MTHYRRVLIPGATWFFTANLADRRSRLLVEHIDVLRKSIAYVQRRHPFKIVAMVVLPDHLHAIWGLPEGDKDYPLRWRLLKTMFSRQIPPDEQCRPSLFAKGERGVWQRRYWEHLIRDDDDLQRHMDYIHFNPVKHGHAVKAVDWPYSTFHRYVEQGWLVPDWGVDAAGNDGFGE